MQVYCVSIQPCEQTVRQITLHQYRLGATWLNNSFRERDLGVLEDKANTGQLCALSAKMIKRILGWINSMQPAGQGEQFFL